MKAIAAFVALGALAITGPALGQLQGGAEMTFLDPGISTRGGGGRIQCFYGELVIPFPSSCLIAVRRDDSAPCRATSLQTVLIGNAPGDRQVWRRYFARRAALGKIERHREALLNEQYDDAIN
jgi:hypothetical protein